MLQPEALYTLSGHNKGITAFEWSNSGYGSANTNIPPLLGTASHDHTLKLWEVEHGTCYSTLQHEYIIYIYIYIYKYIYIYIYIYIASQSYA